MAIQTRPDASATIEELSEFYAAHADEIREFDSWTFRVKRRLADAVRDNGPIITASGRVVLEANGYEYPEEIGKEFPGLGQHVVTATVETLEQAERALSLLTEEIPTADVGHTVKVDGKKAASLIAQGGAAAHRILDLRVAKGRLAVSK